MRRLRPSLALMANIIYLFPIVAGHSWVEELTVIAKNGTFIGDPGFPRGYVPRDKPGFSDPMMQYLLPLPPASRPGPPHPGPPKILPTDNICKDTQMKQVQTDGKPRLKAPPGSPVALRYQENGHVTIPSNTPGKPENRGTVYVYGTTDPKPDDKFTSIHKVWTQDGTGGDRRGMLLSVQNYDDGRCYQINDHKISKERQKQFPHENDTPQGQNLWCQHDLALPKNAPEGKPYTLYWVWDWPTIADEKNGIAGHQEIYTTCMDIDITSASKLKVVAQGEPSTLKFAEGQDLGSAAIPTQFENLQAPTIPGDLGAGSSPPPSTPSTAASQEPLPTGGKPTPSPSSASEPETRPDPAGDCGYPPVPVTATQVPDTSPSDTLPAIVPLIPSTPISGSSLVPMLTASPEPSTTDNKGGNVFTIIPGTLVLPTESTFATPSHTPTASPAQPFTNSGSGLKSVTPLIFPSPEGDASPSPSGGPLFFTILESGPATAVTATSPSASPSDVVTPNPPSTPESSPTPSYDGGPGFAPLTLDPDGNLPDPSPSTTKIAATTPTNPTTLDYPEDSSHTPQPTRSDPESNPPAIIPLLPNRPSNSFPASNSPSNVLPTVAESPTSTQPQFLVSTVTVTAIKTVYPTSPPDSPLPTPPTPTPTAHAQAQGQAKAQTAPTAISPSSGFIVSIRRSAPSPPPSPSPQAAELPPRESPEPDCVSDHDNGSFPLPTPTPALESAPPPPSPPPSQPSPSGPSKRAFRTLSSRFRRDLAEIRAGGRVV
ncbi:hypothetical protein I7I53_04808 [Histoplasma capsulatum var. duboisii H88]|uniref:DUF7492 domain-containing protein n=2 Tax=Ajellomyces capsulatus (strain H88) TaxID=544711 RepID=A0A8A1LQL1_AJEC8|nr:hypothetical protein I7I53_04808 [Histoplasma capsulatum var. duboisii H88]